MNTENAVYEKFDNELKELLTLRGLVWERYLIAIHIKNHADSKRNDIWCSSITKKISANGASADGKYEAIIAEMDRIIEFSKKSCEIINDKILGVLSQMDDYSTKLNLNSLWKSGVDIDMQLAAKGVERTGSEGLEKYSDRLGIEIDGLYEITIAGTPSEDAIKEMEKVASEQNVPKPEYVFGKNTWWIIHPPESEVDDDD